MFDVTDIHTHFLRHDAIVNMSLADSPEPGYCYSCGIHPWDADKASDATFARLEELLSLGQVKAVGEAGIDLLRGVASIEQQIEVFTRQIELSEHYGKPMIIHCVKGWNELMALHRRLKPTQPWIVHGFRGKPQLAKQLVDEGMYISLGAKFNAATAAVIPADRLLFETDDDPEAEIEQVRQAVLRAIVC